MYMAAIAAFNPVCSIIYISMKPVPNSPFRIHFLNAMELHLQSEARDYLNHLWLEAPDSFDVDVTLAEFLDYIDEHFRMVWIYTGTDD